MECWATAHAALVMVNTAAQVVFEATVDIITEPALDAVPKVVIHTLGNMTGQQEDDSLLSASNSQGGENAAGQGEGEGEVQQAKDGMEE